MYYITAVSDDNTLYEITNCLSKDVLQISKAKLVKLIKEEQIISNAEHLYFDCIEVPTEQELHELYAEHCNSIKHEEDSRYFLFISKSTVRTLIKPLYTLGIYKGDGVNEWTLYLLCKNGKGTTKQSDLAYITDDKGQALRKLNAINLKLKNKTYFQQYKLYELNKALKIIEGSNA